MAALRWVLFGISSRANNEQNLFSWNFRNHTKLLKASILVEYWHLPYQFLQLLPDFKKNKKLPQMLGEYFNFFKVFQSFANTRIPRRIPTFGIQNKEHQTPVHNHMIRMKQYVSGLDKNSVCPCKIKCFDMSTENKQTDHHKEKLF